jgi:hypothetical protein
MSDMRLTVHGLDDLDDAFEAFMAELAAELAPGFVPEAQYHGMAGEPFTVEKIDLVAEQTGLL